MELSYPKDASPHCQSIKLVMSYSKSELKVSEQPTVSLKTPEATLTGINTICKTIALQSSPDLLGGSPEDVAQVNQWLSFVYTQLTPITDDKLADLNSWLASRTFFVGHAVSLADLVLYAHLSSAIPKFPVAQQSVFCHLLRWYDHLHNTVDTTGLFAPVALPPASAPKLDTVTAAIAAAEARAAASKAEAAKGGDKGGKSESAGSAATTSKAAAKAAKGGKGAAACAGDSGCADASASTPAKAAKGNKAAGDAAGGKTKGEGKKGAPAAADAAPRIDQLDIRVGTITAVQKHPNADGLYLEEIDVGEDAPRQVISGLVKFVTEDAMRGRRVAVVCNLKPAKMRDVMSYGMVLCASNEAHDAVDPVLVPEGVPNGERILCEGFDNAPDAPHVNPKKKVIEKLFPDMKTNADAVACFQGKPFTTSKGNITSTLTDAWVK